jgi:hypothetical protein
MPGKDGFHIEGIGYFSEGGGNTTYLSTQKGSRPCSGAKLNGSIQFYRKIMFFREAGKLVKHLESREARLANPQ